MADISSFLSEGAQIPAGSAVKSMTSQTVLPEWYTNYAMQLLANQQAQMATPYQAYQGPRVAEFSPAQQQSFAATGQAANAYQPALGAATEATQNLMGKNALGSAQPFFNQAAQMSSLSSATPAYQQALGAVQQGTATGGLNAAQPYLAQAGQNATNVSAYMNPYISQVVDRAGEMGARTLREQLMPAIEGRYIQAGQLGAGPRSGSGTPSGMMTDTARALRDVDENVRAQQSQLLSQGYGQAQQAAQADMARQAQLASTAGGLGSAQQQALLQGAGIQAGIGTQMGQFTGQQQQMLADIGSQTGALQGGDLARQLNAAQQLAGMGSMAQTLGLQGAGALGAVGTQQQTQAQKNLDTAYGDFLRQQGYNQEQINNALATFKGLGSAVPTATQEYGVVPSGQPAQYQPSTAATIGGALTGLAGIVSKFM